MRGVRLATWGPRWIGAASIATIIAVWAFLSGTGRVNDLLLPGPSAVLKAGVALALDGTLLTDITASLGRVVAGFLVALAIAIPLGILMGISRTVHYAVDPLVEVVRPIPPIAIIPLAMLWFGIGEASKVFLIAYSAFFPILLNTIAGFHAIDPIHMRAALTLGANRFQIYRYVVLMSIFPHVVVGARLGMAMGFIVLVAVELIAASSGLGFRIQEARQYFRTDQILVGIVVIGLLGLLLNHSLLALERRVVRWRFLGTGE